MAKMMRIGFPFVFRIEEKGAMPIRTLTDALPLTMEDSVTRKSGSFDRVAMFNEAEVVINLHLTCDGVVAEVAGCWQATPIPDAIPFAVAGARAMEK